MLMELSPIWLVAVNILAWLFIHLATAWAITQLPDRCFPTNNWLCLKRSWERNGRFYEQVCHIRVWKRLLPDAAAIFKKGFRKRAIDMKSPEYFERFQRETCRAEIVHWVVLFFSFVFFVWN